MSKTDKLKPCPVCGSDGCGLAGVTLTPPTTSTVDAPRTGRKSQARGRTERTARLMRYVWGMLADPPPTFREGFPRSRDQLPADTNRRGYDRYCDNMAASPIAGYEALEAEGLVERVGL